MFRTFFSPLLPPSQLIILLSEKGADIHGKDSTGKSVMMFAAGSGSVESVRVLSEKSADIHGKDSTGKSVVMFAAESGSVEVLQIFYDRIFY